MSTCARVFASACFVVSALLASPGFAQRGVPPRDGAALAPPPVGTASISGAVVTTDATPRPVRRASITLRDTDRGANRQTVADDTGRFAFDELPDGRYTLMVSKPAYVPVAYGARALRGQGLTIALAAGQRVSDITVQIMRGAVLTGRVIDQMGRPATSARVTASERIVVGGETTYRPGGVGAQIDDRGVYRIFGLAPGTYVLSVAPGSVRWRTRRARRRPTKCAGHKARRPHPQERCKVPRRAATPRAASPCATRPSTIRRPPTPRSRLRSPSLQEKRGKAWM